MPIILDMHVSDVRFPTSRGSHGSDAMNPDPDYSAAYVTLGTDDGQHGYGLVFTLGRGTELCVQAVEAYRASVLRQDLDEIFENPAAYWRRLTADSQLRWLGPEKGPLHMAAGAIINALWDLQAKRRQLPLWQLLCEMTPEQIVRCIDFRYLENVLTADDALRLLQTQQRSRATRISHLQDVGLPAYTTSAGWLGYSDDVIRQRCEQAMEAGWDAFKLKVGADLRQDLHRVALVREQIGPDRFLMLDANQVWEVPQAIKWMERLASFDPVWIEEPTSPDDILGHAEIASAIKPIAVATGEMAQNRLVFKQLLQAGAIGYAQIDSCRLGGVNEVLAVLLLSAKFGVPVCPHGGGVGLCEHIQHLAAFDYVCVSGELQNRWVEYVDHLHEHFVSPCEIRSGRYRLPTDPGYSIQMHQESVERFRFDGRNA